MSCNYSKETIIDYFYQELSEADKQAFEEHLPGCEECRALLEELQTASHSLKVWKAPELHIKYVFTREREPWYSRFTVPVFSIRRHPVLASAGSIAACFLILSLVNFKMGYNRETRDFIISTSMFQKPQPQIDYTAITEKLESVQRQNIELMTQILEEYDVHQYQQTSAMMAELVQNWQLQRQMDIDAISTSFSTLQEMTGEELNKNMAATVQLIETVLLPVKFEQVKK